MQLVLSKQAKADLENIFRYIALHSPLSAERVYREIMLSAQRLLDFPNIGKVGRVPNTFEFLISEIPYILVYSVSKDEISLMAVFHSKMNLSKRIESRSNS